MKRKLASLSTALVGTALLISSPAAAQPDDLDPVAVAAATRYALPIVFEGFVGQCFDALEPDGYVLTNSDILRTKFSDGAEEAWPGAKLLILEMAEQEAGEMSTLFDALDDEDLRPFIDGVLQNVVAGEIRQEDCSQIERALEIFDPMPADNMAALIGFIVEVVMEERAEAALAIPTPEMTESRARKLREQEGQEAEK